MDRAVAWSDEMLLGIPVMDTAHKFFLDELARLSILADDAIGRALSDLMDFLERNFHEEEAWIGRTFGFVDARHCEDHARVIRTVRQAAAELLPGDTELVRLTLRQLRRWFLNHLTTMDVPLAVAYEMNGHHDAPPPSSWLRAELAHRLYRNGIAV
ncbi:MAG TPA: hemerythrin family protein [Pseudoduganella sp.]